MFWIIDSSAVINSRGVVSLARGEKIVTTNLVIDEIKDFTSRMLLETLQSSTDFSIFPVSQLQQEMRTVKGVAARSKKRLSMADLSVAALAYHFRSQDKENTVLTDDYLLQNLLSNLGLRYRSVQMPGIKITKKYGSARCMVCKKILDDEKTCPHCGTAN
ncbi:MAG: DNA-binding protein [Candidatus Odinarchaeota archaeon]